MQFSAARDRTSSFLETPPINAVTFTRAYSTHGQLSPLQALKEQQLLRLVFYCVPDTKFIK